MERLMRPLGPGLCGAREDLRTIIADASATPAPEPGETELLGLTLQ